MDRVILHCDLNSFYAWVELLSHPELRHVPLAVSGDSTSCYGILLLLRIFYQIECKKIRQKMSDFVVFPEGARKRPLLFI